MKKIKSVSLFFFIVTVVLLTNTYIIFADSNGLPFSVEPILPENQDKNIGGYISVSPKGNTLSQDFQFKITNQSNQDQDIKITLVDAYTSPNGVIQYVKNSSENSKIVNNQYKLSNYLESEIDIITLKKGETKIISTLIDVDNIEGVLLGGVSFSAIEKGNEVKEMDSTFQINNQINMVVGIMVSFVTDNEATFIIEEPEIDPMPSYYAIRLPITLDAPVLQQNVLISYKVMHQNKQLFANEKNFNFAPYTKTNVSIPFEHEEIKANEKYMIKGKLIYQNRQGGEVVKEFEETFIYEKDNAVSTVVNTLTAPIEKGDFPLWTLLFLIIPIALIYYAIRKRKKSIKTPETPSIK